MNIKYKTVTTYVADDGTEFEYEIECLEYEMKERHKKELSELREECYAKIKLNRNINQCPN